MNDLRRMFEIFAIKQWDIYREDVPLFFEWNNKRKIYTYSTEHFDVDGAYRFFLAGYNAKD